MLPAVVNVPLQHEQTFLRMETSMSLHSTAVCGGMFCRSLTDQNHTNHSALEMGGIREPLLLRHQDQLLTALTRARLLANALTSRLTTKAN